MEHTFLSVGYRNVSYAIDVLAVREVVWLPALSPLEEMPPYICGMFNLRGRIVPVLDLGLRFSEGRTPRSPTDRVVVIEQAGRQVGIVVNDVESVITIRTEDLEPIDAFEVPGSQRRFLSGGVKLEHRLLMLLDTAALLDEAADIQDATPDVPLPDGDGLYESRARALAKTPPAAISDDLASYAMFRLDGELFGLEVAGVQEFVNLRGLTPLPCTPTHVAGNINLRGDILTVFDVRVLLGLASAVPAAHAAVIRHDSLRFGVLLESVDGIVSFPASAIEPAPATADGRTNCCDSVVALEAGVASLLDSSRLARLLKERTSADLTAPSTYS